MRAAAQSLQLANVPVRDAVAAAHRIRAFARAHAVLAPSSDSDRVTDAVRHLAFHPFRALRVPETPGPPARLALSGGAYGTAVALVQDVAGEAISRDGRAERFVTFVRTADDMAFGDPGFTQGGREKESRAQDRQKHFITAD